MSVGRSPPGLPEAKHMSLHFQQASKSAIEYIEYSHSHGGLGENPVLFGRQGEHVCAMFNVLVHAAKAGVNNLAGICLSCV